MKSARLKAIAGSRTRSRKGGNETRASAFDEAAGPVAGLSRMCSTAARDLGGVHLHARAAVPPQRRPGGRGVPHRAARRARSLGSRTAGGTGASCRRSSTTRTPATRSTSSSPVGAAGVVTHWAWVAEPLRKHPLDRPFAWALVQLDGADTSLLHALDVAVADDVRTGMRVQIRWSDERRGPHHRHRLLRAGGRPMTRRRRREEGGPVRFMQQHISLDYVMRVSPIAARFAERPRAGRDPRPRVPVVRARVRAAPGVLPDVHGGDGRGRTRSRSPTGAWSPRSRSSRRSSTTGRQEREDYALASILLDGADGTVGQQRLARRPARAGPHGPAGRGGVGGRGRAAGRRRRRDGLRLRHGHHRAGSPPASPTPTRRRDYAEHSSS